MLGAQDNQPTRQAAKRLREDAKSRVHEMYLAPTRKLALEAEKHWRRLNSYTLITRLIQGDTFTNGELVLKEAA